MKFVLGVLSPGLILLVAGVGYTVLTLDSDTGGAIAGAGMVWCFLMAPLIKRYTRTRITAKAWRDARRAG